MPLFRYEIDDRITIMQESCSCGCLFRLVQSIQGRSDDNFFYEKDISISPEIFEDLIFPEGGIDEYQVFQTIQGAVLWIIASGNVDTHKMQHSLAEEYRHLGLIAPDYRSQDCFTTTTPS